jgi:hypothetical protein
MRSLRNPDFFCEQTSLFTPSLLLLLLRLVTIYSSCSKFTPPAPTTKNVQHEPAGFGPQKPASQAFLRGLFPEIHLTIVTTTFEKVAF